MRTCVRTNRERPMPTSSRRTIRRLPGMLAVVLAAQALVAGCASPARLAAVPSASTVQAQAGIPNARFFLERDNGPIMREALSLLEREKAYLASTGHTGPLPP